VVVALRNLAIILLLALVVAAAPAGGHVADGLLALISVIFLVLIAAAGYVGYRQNRLAYLALTDGQRATLIGAAGAIVLMIAGTDELLESGGGTLLWIAVLAGSAFAIFRVVAEARSY
jgi:hypothetical protein